MRRVLLLCASGGILLGQAALPTFRVVSIKPANPDSRHGALVNFTPGGGLRIVNATLRDLIETGYQVRNFQIVVGAPWTATAKYDVTATSEEGAQQQPSTSEVRLKVQALLKDRFQLQLHQDTRELPIYSL